MTYDDLITQLAIDTVFGCLTRQALEVLHKDEEYSSLIFFDIDHMHDLNEQFGYEEVNNRIRHVLGNIRHGLDGRADDLVVSRWFAGDEFVILVKSGIAYGFAHRLMKDFKDVGISITCGITHSVIAGDFKSTVQPAADAVQKYKSWDLRGTITTIRN